MAYLEAKSREVEGRGGGCEVQVFPSGFLCEIATTHLLSVAAVTTATAISRFVDRYLVHL